MGNKYLQLLPNFYEHMEKENDEIPTPQQKYMLEEFCDWLQQNYEEEKNE